jgi:hypothetical protein
MFSPRPIVAPDYFWRPTFFSPFSLSLFHCSPVIRLVEVLPVEVRLPEVRLVEIWTYCGVRNPPSIPKFRMALD